MAQLALAELASSLISLLSMPLGRLFQVLFAQRQRGSAGTTAVLMFLVSWFLGSIPGGDESVVV